jgi:hypothetical protein
MNLFKKSVGDATTLCGYSQFLGDLQRSCYILISDNNEPSIVWVHMHAMTVLQMWSDHNLA